MIDPPLHLRLDRHLSTELGVGGSIDLTHPAGAQPGSDSVVGERLADQVGVILTCRMRGAVSEYLSIAQGDTVRALSAN